VVGYILHSDMDDEYSVEKLSIAMNSDMAIIINLFVLPDKFKKSFVLLLLWVDGCFSLTTRPTTLTNYGDRGKQLWWYDFYLW